MMMMMIVDGDTFFLGGLLFEAGSQWSQSCVWCI